ncbi:hypothetical protein [Streptomyces sp. NPDC002402]
MQRQLLALDAARYGDRGLSARFTAVPVAGRPTWSSSSPWPSPPNTTTAAAQD